MWRPAKWQLCSLMAGTCGSSCHLAGLEEEKLEKEGKGITLLKPLVTKLIASSWLIDLPEGRNTAEERVTEGTNLYIMCNIQDTLLSVLS